MQHMSSFIVLTLSAFCLLSATVAKASDDPSDGLARPLDDAECWKRLPPTTSGGEGKLPSWARMLAGELPRTTAALLQLDFAQRTKSPLDPKVRAAMRLAAAVVNRCAYSQEYAAFDARSAGLAEDLVQAIKQGNYDRFNAPERHAIEFVVNMSKDSASVSDEAFAELVKDFGERKTSAMVLLAAYANFQDRLLTCLGAKVESGGPTPPPDLVFQVQSLGAKSTPPPPRTDSSLPESTGKDEVADAPDWSILDYPTLQEKLERQRSRKTRVSVPSWAEVEKGLPKGFSTRPSRIVWNLVCLGHVPELAAPFETVMFTAGSEGNANWDRVFGSGLFWVTTKAVNCAYCMGHCEMNWEVVGLTKDEIAHRSKLLAGTDWSSFPPAEQRAFAFARKLSQAPWEIKSQDLQTLKEDFGPTKALLIALNASRYHYMTRISNGFQLSLERDNVFFEYYNVPNPNGEAKVTAARSTESMLTSEEAWKRMPKTVSGEGQTLPVWARSVAVHLPRTAAAMLELDFAQRTKSPIDPMLRAKMRWVVARANRCSYSEAYALADLKREGADESVVKNLTGSSSEWSHEDRQPLEFARQLTLSASTISDDLFKSLRDRFGDKRVAAMVLLAAYGNFFDRLVLGLGLPLEKVGPMPPLEVKFAREAFQTAPFVPPHGAVPELLKSGRNVIEPDQEWDDLSFDELQSRLEQQRGRSPRLPIPTWDEVKKNLPPAAAAKPTRIIWNLVCSGYCPELAVPWSTATRTMWSEFQQDRVFEESLFWVQTRSIRCNYCMGHCQMLMEVAGLDKYGIAERTRRLASDDWSAFPPEEQRAFAYARKLTKTPWDLTRADYETLVNDLGPKRAFATFWWLCRGLYMTRVSDGFQLPLERENVFADPKPASLEKAPTGSK